MFFEKVMSSFTGSKFRFEVSMMVFMEVAGALRTQDMSVQLRALERDFHDSIPPERPAASDCIIAARKERGEGGMAISCFTL